MGALENRVRTWIPEYMDVFNLPRFMAGAADCSGEIIYSCDWSMYTYNACLWMLFFVLSHPR